MSEIELENEKLVSNIPKQNCLKFGVIAVYSLHID